MLFRSNVEKKKCTVERHELIVEKKCEETNNKKKKQCKCVETREENNRESVSQRKGP